jgi:hypothetical protein
MDFIHCGHYGTDNVRIVHGYMDEAGLRFEPWTNDILSAHFYAVSARILLRLIAHLDTPGQETGPMPVDAAYNIFVRNTRMSDAELHIRNWDGKVRREATSCLTAWIESRFFGS